MTYQIEGGRPAQILTQGQGDDVIFVLWVTHPCAISNAPMTARH
ncbi:MAG: hypothetical protein WBD13_23320 [Burkholderiaceae bacterium]